jgi:hypothetical protein
VLKSRPLLASTAESLKDDAAKNTQSAAASLLIPLSPVIQSVKDDRIGLPVTLQRKVAAEGLL